MMGETKHETRAIFTAALTLNRPADRACYLDQACEGKPELRQRVDALLQAAGKAGEFLTQDALGGPLDCDAPPVSEGPGTVIGHYKLLEQIGEGGFGVVFMAEQVQPIRRQVALKVVKPGMDTRQVIARFEAERQALAMMNHPNIAQVFDAGATESGRPYFVMELVHGVPLTQFCDANQLTPQERLRLFQTVCEAVQHAHQKGIIHRDLKPSNILVTLHDGKPVPKVIDFGTAKALQQPLTEKTLFTAYGKLIGTPQYMSPEQAEMSGLDVDTRADIYSLGVLLYELLTGTTPFEGERLRTAAFEEMIRIIREEEPPRPSTRVSTLGAGATEIANHRHVDPALLRRTLQGDLDWIAMKALEKDRTRRYETASALVEDLQHHLNHEPVRAGPPGAAYRARKFVRRHQVGVAVGAAAVVILVIGLSLALLGLQRALRAESIARQERDHARAAELRAITNEKKALTEATRSAQVAQFLKEMLKSVDPIVALGQDTTLLRGILDKTAERVGKDLKDQPEVEAELRSIIGNTYFELGDYTKAEAMQSEALRLRKGLFGETNRFVADSLSDLSNPVQERGAGKEAESLVRQSLAIRRTLFGEEHLEVARSLNRLAELVDDLTEAETLERRAVATQKKLLRGPHLDLVWSLETLGLTLDIQGKLEEAEAVEREGLAMSRELFGTNNPEAATLLGRLGRVYASQGRLSEAEGLIREGLAMRRKLLGQEHKYVAISLQNLVGLLKDQRKWAEAEPLARECLAIWQKASPDAYETLYVRSVLGEVLAAQNKFGEAEPLLRTTFEAMTQSKQEIPAEDMTQALALLIQLHDAVGWSDTAEKWLRGEIEQCRQAAEHGSLGGVKALIALATVLQGRGDQVEAIALLRLAAHRGNVVALNDLAWTLATSPSPGLRDGVSAIAFAEKAVAATNRKEAYILDTLAAACAEAGQFTNAILLQEEAIALLRDGDEKQDYASRLKLYVAGVAYYDHGLLARQASSLIVQGKFAEAEPLARQCLALREKQIPDHWLTFNARSMVGGCLLGQKKYAQAAPLLLSAYDGLQQREAAIPAFAKPRLQDALERLVQLCTATGRGQEAAEWKKKLAAFEENQAVGKSATIRPSPAP